MELCTAYVNLKHVFEKQSSKEVITQENSD